MKKLCQRNKSTMNNVTKLDLPIFSNLDINKIQAEVEASIDHCRKVKENLLHQKTFNWNSFIYPLEEAEDKLSKTFGPLAHLNAVNNTAQLRDVFQSCMEKISEHSTHNAQDRRLLAAYQCILKDDIKLDSAQIKAIKNSIRDFKLCGVHLDDDKRNQFEEIVIKLEKIKIDFENNVLDATMAWHYLTEDKKVLEGLTDSVMEQAKEKAKAQGKDGFSLGLDAPTYTSLIQQADNRQLREKFYHAYMTRASDQAENKSFNNTKIMKEIIQLKTKQAQLLGFKNYVEVSLVSKMATSVDEVINFLTDLYEKAKPHAQKELDKLKIFAVNNGAKEELKSWDISYYSEKMKKAEYGFTGEELRSYFPLKHVIKGFMKIIKSLYGVKANEIQFWDRYQPETNLYEFHDENNVLRGAIIVDLFARENKRDGAWMDECSRRYKRLDGSIQIPIAYVTCNFMPPKKGKDALLVHNDVLTLFHEFGHALHHILTQVDYLPISGINGIEWDAVELPSQFMENFCWCEEGLKILSQHIDTKEPLPVKLFKKLVASRHYQSGLAMLRQLEFALFDIHLHLANVESFDIHQIIKDLRKSKTLLDVPEYNRFENSFSHIFAGGYAAGYYSYKWAEVLSSDAFSVFESKSSVLDKCIGQKFMHEILEKGGSEPAARLFKAFRGQKPTVDALLRHNGIV